MLPKKLGNGEHGYSPVSLRSISFLHSKIRYAIITRLDFFTVFSDLRLGLLIIFKSYFNRVFKITDYLKIPKEAISTIFFSFWLRISAKVPCEPSIFLAFLSDKGGKKESALDRPALIDDELVALEEAVSSWCLFTCSLLSSYIISQRWANYCVRGSITALICQVTSSELTDTLGDVSISWSDILLGVFSIKFSISVLLSIL